MKKLCKKCFKEFKTYNRKQVYCSRKCWNYTREVHYEEKICPICNKKFKVKLSEKTRKYCSTECYKEYCKSRNGRNNPFYGKHHSKESIDKWKKKRDGYKHSKEAKKKMSKARKGKKFTIEHRRNMSKATYKGAKYRNWKERIRRSFEYKIWRENVFKRDDWRCQECKKRGNVYIEAHHIFSFAYYPNLRFEIGNGITLCRKCHKKLTSLQMLNNKNGRKKK